MPDHPKKPCRDAGPDIPDPLVDPGNPPHRHEARATAHPTRTRHCMVFMAARPSSRSAPRTSQKEKATVMLALQLRTLLISESMGNHDSGGHGCLVHRLRRRWGVWASSLRDVKARIRLYSRRNG